MGKIRDSSEGGTTVVYNTQRQKQDSVWLSNLPRVAELMGGGAGI